jgi:hypothetical protein
MAQGAPKYENTKATAAQSHTNAAKQTAGTSEPPRVRKLAGDEQTIAVKRTAAKTADQRRL